MYSSDYDAAFDAKKPESEVNVSLNSSAQSRKQDDKTKKKAKAEMDQDDAVVLEDDKKEDREVVDAVKDVEKAKKDKTEPADESVTAASAIITTAEAQVPDATLTAAPARVVAAPSIRRKRVVIRDLESESTTFTIIHAETKSKDKGKGILVEEPKPLKKKKQIEQDEQYARELHAELNKDIDWDEVIDHVKIKAKEDAVVKKYQAMKRKPQTEGQTRKNMMLYLKNVAGFKMDYFKGMSYDDIRPIFEAKFISNVAFLLKTKEHIEEDENRALQKLNETPVERETKRIKLDEEVEELKRHLQIVPNEDDDVYTKATPLARKKLNETLAERAAKRRKLDEEVEELKRHLQVVPNEDDDVYTKAIPLSQKLILLVERKYLLIRFTLNQMLNAITLEVEEESEASLELLRCCHGLEEKHAKCLMLLVKDLVLPSKLMLLDNAAETS
nr:hypothetical protein [Tanacetum cinerariifolium]